MAEDLPPAIPAATLILMRTPPHGGAPEILFVERAQTMAFAAGALVFPGGRIDAEDHHAAALLAPHLDDGAARVAAVRETIEETGIAPLLPAAAAAQLRTGLAAGEPLPALLDTLALALDLAALTPFARWCPNFRETRRFDTMFYLAEASPDAPEPRADDAESARSFWGTAGAVLADVEAGRAQAIFPTRRNLERLAGFASIEAARADAAAHPVARITPWVEERDGRRFVCIPEGIGYPVTAEPYETARRH